MDSRGPALAPGQHAQTEQITTTAPPYNEVDESKVAHMAPSEEDRINQMTLNTAAQPTAGIERNGNAGVVMQQPGATPGMRPENYVIRLENLGESSDYVDCPYCKSRQRTQVRHESTSQTS